MCPQVTAAPVVNINGRRTVGCPRVSKIPATEFYGKNVALLK